MIFKNQRLKNNIFNKAIFLMLLLVLFTSGDSMGEAMSRKSAKYNFFPFIGDPDYKATNGYDFFEHEGKIYNIVWQAVGSLFNYTYDSKLVFRSNSDNNWFFIHIEGKAYYLGPYFNHEICSIRQDQDKWHIAFYNLQGTKLREFEHHYRKFEKEYYHYTPIPLVYPDGSIIFYSMYEYEGRNIILKSLLGLISGGHGSKREIGEHVEIIPELMRNNKRKIFSYAVCYDNSNLRTVFPIDDEYLRGNDNLKKRATNVNDYVIDVYELCGRDGIAFIKNGMLVKISNSMVALDMIDPKKNMPYFNIALLDAEVKKSIEYLINNLYYRHDADVWVDSDGLILVAEKNKKVYIDFYDSGKKEWIRNIMNKNNVDFYGYRNIRIHKSNGYLYIGFWSNDKQYEIVKCKWSDLITKGIIDIVAE